MHKSHITKEIISQIRALKYIPFTKINKKKLQDLPRQQGQTDLTVCRKRTTLSHLSPPTDVLRTENMSLPHKTDCRSIKTQRNWIYLSCIKSGSGFRKMTTMPDVSSIEQTDSAVRRNKLHRHDTRHGSTGFTDKLSCLHSHLDTPQNELVGSFTDSTDFELLH